MNDQQAVTFREATAEDLDAVLQLLADDDLRKEAVSLDPADRGVYEEAFAMIEANPHDAVIVGERDGDLIATLQLTFLPGLTRRGQWRAQVENVRVSSVLRGEGIGHQMMDYVIERCRERKCGLVQLTTDKRRDRARSFYESLGFEASHEGMKLVFDSRDV